jgi:ADP-ribose pyrophosphatase
MVDPGEKVSITLKREFSEEALNSLETSPEERRRLETLLGNFFDQGTEVYRGYVDDPRNTDNAWMETVAVNFHDDVGESVGMFPLCAGDDAVGVTWTDVSSALKLYASHVQLLEKVAQLRHATW